MYMAVKNIVNGGNKETSSSIKTFEGIVWENCQMSIVLAIAGYCIL